MFGKMKNAIAVGIILIILLVSISGCNEQPVNSNGNNTNDGTLKIISFSVTQSSIKEGNTSELQWEVINADYVRIDNGIGFASLTGKRVVSPTINTTYTLTAIKGEKEANASVHIVVIASSIEEKLVGTWYFSEEVLNITRTLTYIFSPDKKYEIIHEYQNISESFIGTWKIEEDKLIVTIEGKTITGDYKFSNNNKTLTITDTDSKLTTVLTKQE
jgi:hypothetical protein